MNIKFLIYLLTISICFLNASNYANLDQFDDLELESLDYPKNNTDKKTSNKQRLILFDDNLYLLEDDFDFGTDEIELQKLELNPRDMETAQEYENFLNVFFENSEAINNPFNAQGAYQSKKGLTNAKNLQSSRNNSPGNNKRGRSTIPRGHKQQPGKLGIGISTILGATIPMGTNLKSNFNSGSNFGVHIESPISFNIGSKEARVGSDIYLSSMSSTTSGGSSYNLTNLNATISLFINKSIEIKAGLGLSPSSIGDYNKTLFSVPVDINYHLPFEVSGFGLALSLRAQETLGIPTDNGTEDSKATSEFINVGFFIKTPLAF